MICTCIIQRLFFKLRSLGRKHGTCTAVLQWVLVGKPEGKRPLGRSRRGWEDNIKMDLQELGCWGYVLDRAGSG